MSLLAFIPNTSVTVWRTPDNTETVDYGDPYDTQTAVPALASVPVLWRSKLQRTWDPEERQVMISTVYTVRFRPGSDVREYDRLKNDRTGEIAQVTNSTTNPSPVGSAMDVTVTASAVS